MVVGGCGASRVARDTTRPCVHDSLHSTDYQAGAYMGHEATHMDWGTIAGEFSLVTEMSRQASASPTCDADMKLGTKSLLKRAISRISAPGFVSR